MEIQPPYASHMGGVWEQMIRSVRKVMTNLLHKQIIDDERLDTIFCEVESILNNRPLTPVSEDAYDLTLFTPNHLLLLKPGPQGLLCATSDDDNFNKRWKQVQHVANCFWKRWMRSYLPTLKFRSKWFSEEKKINVGSLVLYNELNTPRQDWPLAKVLETYKGTDNLIKSVKLKTATSTVIRPISKLCLLEGCH